MKHYIAVDIGGTRMRAASYSNENTTPLKINRIAAQAPNSKPEERISDVIQSVWPKDGEVLSIGMAVPGPVDPDSGELIAAPNIPDLVNIPLTQYLKERFNVPVALGNDANLAALGEWKYGAGKGHRNLIYLTVSTGIGSGLIVDNRLLIGGHGMGAELGHTTILPGGPVCSCGHRGHLEAVASGPAIARWYENEITRDLNKKIPSDQQLSAKSLAEAVQHGDLLAKAAFKRAGSFIGLACANFLHTFNPTAIIFGGGVSKSSELWFDALWASLRQHVVSPDYLEDFIMTTAALGDDAGLVGALLLAKNVIK